MKHVIWKRMVLSLIALLPVFFCLCFGQEKDLVRAQEKQSRVVFRYQKSQTDMHSVIQLTKCIYDAEGLHVYMSQPVITEKLDITCYDEEYRLLNCDWEFTFEEDHFTISGKDSYKIRGLKLGLELGLLYVRELASTQFTSLEYNDVTDGGFHVMSGDPAVFYTEWEKEEMRQEEMERFNRFSAEVYPKLEGTWVSTEDPEMKLIFGYDSGKWEHYFHYTEKSETQDGRVEYSTRKTGLLGTVFDSKEPGLIQLLLGRRNAVHYQLLRYSEDMGIITYGKSPELTYVRQ